MRISASEQADIIKVLAAGQRHGYGNMIAHLQTAWAKMLVESGLDESTARSASGGDGYPFAMQDDLVRRGFWDESGESYRTPNPEPQP